MNLHLLDYFRLSRPRSSAAVAKERLRIIVEHERNLGSTTLSYLPMLQQELLAVVRKYVIIEDDKISINLEKDGDYEILELNITLPDVDGRQGKK
jgi:cell division topological specificity factor